MDDIIFKFEGVKYQVSYNAFKVNAIKLPDGRVLAVEGWFETCPPYPMNLVVDNDPLNSAPVAIAL